MSPTYLCWQHHRLSLVLATGADARNYLHRRTCNDVAHLAIGQHQLNAVLERKAELRALFDLTCLADDAFLLLTETTTAEALLHELNRFVITEDVRFTLLPPMALLASLGQVGELPPLSPLPQPILPTRLASPFLAWGWLTQQTKLSCTLHLLPPEAEATLPQALPNSATTQWLTPQQASAWQHVGGLASFAQAEWDNDTLLPALGVDALAVSTTKGCYLGQETVAKLHTYGNVPKRLMAVLWETCPLSAEDLPLAQGQHLPLVCTTDGQQAGQLVSLEPLPTLAPLANEATRPWLGLAYLKRAYRTPDTPLVVQGGGDTVCQQVASFPLPVAWWQQPTPAPFNSASDDTNEAQALALHRQAMACYLADQGDEALALLDEALALHPTCWPALESKGVVLGRLGRTHEAIAVLKAWQAQQPNAVMAYSNLSLCYAQLGDKETAEQYKAEATRLTMRLAMQAAVAKKQASAEPSSSSPPEEITLTPEQRATLEQRAELLQHALSVAPNDALALYGLGSTYFSLGQYPQAVTYLQQTVAVSPKHSKAYAQLATAHLGLQQTAQAAAVAQQGLAVATTAGDLQVVAQLNTLLASLPALQGLG